ncbi:MAG: preprotein translocase subunit SecE [Parcubacteria group bacterium CG1_02_42_13]|uniref:Protein translocase subunit SecE n=1 Tax=Candidatus Colwellbacteria bacterium CG23_combo_of_CG06-09_8_20_14_all_42_19 TaxID=1974541 RepID=A0A2H0AL15_9BACT|nr:MAG: preprotein translocase subunit SecE [Parcubacteria group bacterium CG1_02_42_13]PIP46102.1 MAG: preprotein translocase subunit SecE [Candidatus Colwellbacteria bacterium CG23_combo_of_CG06-09_8_20_14_all_42_19]
MIGKIKLFLSESRGEFKRINWPTRKEAFRMVFIVVAISVAVAVFLGGADFIFLSLLKRIIS